MAKQKKANNKKRYNALLDKKRRKEQETKALNKARLKEINAKKNEEDSQRE